VSVVWGQSDKPMPAPMALPLDDYGHKTGITTRRLHQYSTPSSEGTYPVIAHQGEKSSTEERPPGDLHYLATT
jgi:hypothetical protein